MPDAATIFDRARLIRLLVVNRDIFIRTALLIAAWGFFAAQGARSGDVVLAANSVLHNLMLVGAFFLDGFALAAEQLCGRAIGAHDRRRVLARGASCRSPGASASAPRRRSPCCLPDRR